MVTDTTIVYDTTLIPSKYDLNLIYNTKQFRSPFNGIVQIIESPGAIWVARLNFDYLLHNDSKRMRSFIAKCHGGLNPFIIPLFNDSQNELSELIDVFEENPLVLYFDEDADAFDNIIKIHNLTTGTIPAGTYFSIGNSALSYRELKISTSDSEIVDNKTTIHFEPPLRIDYTQNNAYIDLVNPKVRMRFIDNQQATQTYSNSLMMNLSMDIIEDIV